MQKKNLEPLLQISIIISTFVMIIIRFLLNEKGRVSPDSIRYMRQARIFPEIDNTTAPLLYPLFIKVFSVFSDEFWASKIIGILAYFFIITFAWKKKFYFKESVMLCGLFCYLSIFSYTMSETLILPFIFLFLYISRQIIIGNLTKLKAILFLSLTIVILYNIRYSSLFLMIGCLFFGVVFIKEKYGKIFIFSSIIGFGFVIFYKIIFVDYFNDKYLQQFLEIGLKPTPQLLKEFFQGITTSFNPFIHIPNPNGGIINYGIFGIGFLNILFIIFLLIKNKLSQTELFFSILGIVGIICSYFIQYFYSVNALDYRLLSPFIFPIWLVYFKKIYQVFGKLTYGITVLSLMTGFVFTWLSRGNYLENRKEITQFLKSEHLENQYIKFYIDKFEDLDKVQVAELISTVNPKINITILAKDTLQKNTLTEYKVLKKIRINKNKYQ